MAAENDNPGRRSAQSSERSFRPDIQGLRAVAVGVVLLYHANFGLVTGGYVGVDAFFVISGFLITGHLLASLRTSEGIQLARFYARRARRILPASLVVLAATVVGAVVVVSPLRLQAILQDAIASALFVPNIRFAIEQTDYLADAAPSPFQHYWSLGVEEQFYLLWPVALALLFFVARRWPKTRALAVGTGAMVVGSLALCLVVASFAGPWAFFSLPTRGWEFGVGALVALLGARATKIPVPLAAAGGWLGLGLIVGSSFVFTVETAYPGWTTLAPVLGTAALIACGTGRPAYGPARLLSLRPMQFVGAISYSLYLVHWPMLVLAGEWAGAELPPATSIAIVIAAVPLAWLLHRTVEVPARDGRRVKKLRPRFVLAGAIVLPAILALALVGSVPVVASAQLTSDQVAAREPLVENPSETAFVPKNIRPALIDATKDTGELYTDGCQQSPRDADAVSCTFGDPSSAFTVALFGDSHAGRWFPALEEIAESRDIRLQTFTKSECRSIELRGAWTDGPNPTCIEWREDALAQMTAAPPDLIILANHYGLTAATAGQGARESWTDGIDFSLAQLPPQSAVVMLADSPEFRASPVPCLSDNLTNTDRCSDPRDDMINRAIVSIQENVSKSTGVGMVDLTDYFCNTQTCPPVIGDTLVYADDHHLTATFALQLAPALDSALSSFLPESGRAAGDG